jgi:hypothetical protein
MRRELPRTRHRGFDRITLFSRILLSVLPRPFSLRFMVDRSRLPYAARALVLVSKRDSTSVPMAQMKPTSSRATAAATLPAGLRQ